MSYNAELDPIIVEASIIWALSCHPENIPDALAVCDESDFQDKLLGKCFSYLKKRYNAGEMVDSTLMFNELKIHPDAQAMIMLQNSYINVSTYCKRLKNRSMRIQIGKLCTEGMAALKDEMLDGAEFATDFHNKLINIIETKAVLSVKNTKEAALEFVEAYKYAQSRAGELLGLSFGINQLDELTSGAKGGELIILAARPGCGKTTLALNITARALASDKAVLFFSLEMQASNLYAKMISHLGALNISAINKACLNAEDEAAMKKWANYLNSKRLLIFDSGFINIDELRIAARKHAREGLDMIVVDYIGLMSSANARLDRHLQIAEITRNLKMLALEMNIPIIALSQLNRAIDARADKRPQLSDLRESGSIEQDADMVIFLSENTQESAPAERPTLLTLAKNRRGQTAVIELDFRAGINAFYEKHTPGQPVSAQTI